MTFFWTSEFSEIGWDELQVQKRQAWEHHLALTILPTWFIAQTKYDWANTHARDAQQTAQLSRIIRTKDPPQLKFPYACAVDINSVLWTFRKYLIWVYITIGGFAYECINKRDKKDLICLS